MGKQPTPRLSKLAYVWFALASCLQVLLLLIALVAALGGSFQTAGLAVVVFLIHFVPSVLIALGEAKRLDQPLMACLRRGYFVGVDVFMSLPF